MKWGYDVAFNSLFEMPTPRRSMPCACCRRTFNSLFEMPVTLLSEKEVSLAPDSFNSLFEMRYRDLKLWPLIKYLTFNSLFEMRNMEAAVTATPV